MDFGIPSPKVTTTSDLDFDVLVRQDRFGAGFPAVLPESAIKVSNYGSRKARLWRKVYYLEYLRELYRRYVHIILYYWEEICLTQIIIFDMNNYVTCLFSGHTENTIVIIITDATDSH